MENYDINYILKVDRGELSRISPRLKDSNLVRVFDTVFATAICQAFSEIPNGLIDTEIKARDYFDVDGVRDQYKVSIKSDIAKVLLPHFKWEDDKEMVRNLFARGLFLFKGTGLTVNFIDKGVDELMNKFGVYKAL